MHNKELSINGKNVKKFKDKQENELWVYDINKHLKKGLNEIVLKIDFYQNQSVYDVFFGNRTEALKNCLTYPTTIEAIYLKGDFGVKGNFKNGKKDNVISGNEFAITSQKNEINNLISDGFPFFKGEITLEQDIEVDNINKILVIDGDFLLIDLFINEKYVSRMMFKKKIDISSFLKLGKNHIKIALTVSNRNLLGPFHSYEEEPRFVGPYSFELLGSWDENGRSSKQTKDYHFIKTIV